MRLMILAMAVLLLAAGFGCASSRHGKITLEQGAGEFGTALVKRTFRVDLQKAEHFKILVEDGESQKLLETEEFRSAGPVQIAIEVDRSIPPRIKIVASQKNTDSFEWSYVPKSSKPGIIKNSDTINGRKVSSDSDIRLMSVEFTNEEERKKSPDDLSDVETIYEVDFILLRGPFED